MKEQIAKKSKIMVILLFSFLTILTMIIDFYPINMNIFKNQNIIESITVYLKQLNLIHFFIGIIIYKFYYDTLYIETNKIIPKKNIVLIIVISLIMFIGKIYNHGSDNLNIITSSITYLVISILYFSGIFIMIYSIVKKYYLIKDNFKIKQISQNENIRANKIINHINNHLILYTCIFIIICRLPYLLVSYPGSITSDAFDSLCQFFNISASWSIKMINLKNNNVYINSHHPMLYTLALGTIVNIGKSISDYNLGIFLFIIFQLLMSTIIILFIIFYLKKIKMPLSIILITIIFYGITPTIQTYSIIAVKDTPNALFNLLYVIFLLQVVKNYKTILENKKNTMIFILIIFLVLSFRNNGIITILLSYPLLFILYKKQFKKLLLVLVIPILLYFSFNQIMYNVFSASKGSKKELLTVPLMQIGRIVKYEENDLTKEDKKIIDRVLTYDGLKDAYLPTYADGIKDRFNKNTSNSDLKKLSKIWYKELKRHPIMYIESLMTCTYKYIYPADSNNYGNIPRDERVYQYFNIKNNKKLNTIKQNIHLVNLSISKLPILGIFFHAGYYVWFLLITSIYVINKKKYKYLIPLSPLLAILLVCFASPLNGSIRYTLPIIFATPIYLVITNIIKKEEKEEKVI